MKLFLVPSFGANYYVPSFYLNFHVFRYELDRIAISVLKEWSLGGLCVVDFAGWYSWGG